MVTMPTLSTTDLVQTLQLATGPVILISGVGLLLLSMTNRYGHTVDRARLLTAALRSPVEEPNDSIHSQLQILAKRATIARMAITLAAVSVLLASFLVITLFIGLLLSLDVALIVVGLFMLCMISLSASLVHFIIDVNLSLKALWLELPDATPR